ncbi:MAG: hypothetical protein WCA46_27790, partial [Actinocatenispora sp.]
VAGCAAVVALVGGGAGVLALHDHGAGQHRITAEPGGRPAHSGAPGAGHDGGATNPPPDATAGPGSSHHSGPGARQVAVQLDHDPVPLPSQSAGVYQGPLTLTVRNTGDKPISLATVELTIPARMSFTADGGAVSCDAGVCVLREIHDLAPGATQTVSGTLSFGSGTGPRMTPSGAGAVRVTTTEPDGEHAVESASFTVTLGEGSSTPTTEPTPSGTPEPSASDAPHGAGDGDDSSQPGDGQESLPTG